jgi:hypothetical protein
VSAGTFDPSGALEAVDRVLNRGGDPAAIVRAVLEALRLRGVEFARVQLLAGDRVIDTFETGSGAATTEAPITYRGARVGTIQVAVARSSRGWRRSSRRLPPKARSTLGGDSAPGARSTVLEQCGRHSSCADPLPSLLVVGSAWRRHPSAEVPRTFEGRSPDRGIREWFTESAHLRCKAAGFSAIGLRPGGGFGVPRPRRKGGRSATRSGESTGS